MSNKEIFIIFLVFNLLLDAEYYVGFTEAEGTRFSWDGVYSTAASAILLLVITSLFAYAWPWFRDRVNNKGRGIR